MAQRASAGELAEEHCQQMRSPLDYTLSGAVPSLGIACRTWIGDAYESMAWVGLPTHAAATMQVARARTMHISGFVTGVTL